MKASEVLEQYAKGKRDFQGVDLKGQSFQGKNLAGADFSEADIRGTDFSEAKLTGAKFIGASAGLQWSWVIGWVVISWLLSGLPELVLTRIAFSATLTLNFLNIENLIVGVILLIVLVTFLVVFTRKGIMGSQGVVAAAITVALAVAIRVTVSGEVAVTVAGVIALALAGTAALAVAVALAEAVAGKVALASALAVALVGAGSLAREVEKAVVVTVAVAKIGAREVPVTGAAAGAVALALTGAVAVAFALLGSFVGWRTLRGDRRDAWVRYTAIAFAAIKGTSFRGADLTDADFTGAILKSTDFRRATLVRTYWYRVQKIDRVRPGETYLRNRQLRYLVTTKNGKDKNFDRLDLRGVNLQKANLANASFIDADFYQASLKGANLSRTILVRANLDRVDLTGANLTGSCIQDWGITKDTKLDGIVCDYVFLKWIDGDKRDQVPARGKFKTGSFVLFIKSILDTIEIYHDKDINPRLALSILKKMSKDYDEPLDIVAMGKRGERVFVRVKLSESVEQERFKQDYYSRYDEGLKLVSSNPKQLPSVDELVENKIIEIASEKIPDDNQSIQVTHVEYIMSGNFGVGVNEGQIIADTIAGAINEE